jgi:hypothetical protein
VLLYLVRGKGPDGKQVDEVCIDLSAAFDAVAKLERRGVTDIRMVEVKSGREIDLNKLCKNREQ